MGLQGDLATLDLAGVFQNLDAARKSGVLTVRDGLDVTSLLFAEGRLTAVSYPSRRGVTEFLVAAGVVEQGQLERARKGRRKARSATVLAVEAGLVEQEQLVAWIAERVTDEACEVLMTRAGRFEFSEGAAPDERFDAEELALGIALSVGPLLLEAARRSDHWKMIRERVPSDSTHYELARQPRPPADPRAAALLESLLPLLDGTRSLGEVAAHFPHARFEVYELLARLAESRSIRPCDPGDLAKRVRELLGQDRQRAWVLLERGLERDPSNLALLSTKALIAEELGDFEQACEALKMVAHVELEGGGAGARAALERLKTLDGDDLFVWEKSFELALSQGRQADALTDGKRLVELYSGPGLHKKAAAVIERLLSLGAPTWELVRELAQLRAKARDLPGAVRVLEDYGAARLREESYALARRAYEELLALDPRSKRARQAIDELASGELVRKRAFWRRLRRRVALFFVAAVVLPCLTWEALARRALAEATRQVLRSGTTEALRREEAAAAYRAVIDAYPWSTVAWYDAQRALDALAPLGAAGE